MPLATAPELFQKIRAIGRDKRQVNWANDWDDQVLDQLHHPSPIVDQELILERTIRPRLRPGLRPEMLGRPELPNVERGFVFCHSHVLLTAMVNKFSQLGMLSILNRSRSVHLGQGLLFNKFPLDWLRKE